MYPSKRRGVSEVVSSLAVLIVTIALLGGIGYLAMGSIRASGGLLISGSEGAAKDDGLLLSLVSVQSNSSGSYAWVYDYGWVEGTLTAAYVNGGLVAWSSTCGGVIRPESVCAVSVPAGLSGDASIDFGGKTLDFAV